MQPILSVRLAQDGERLPLERVVTPDDGHALREVPEVGSVWWLPSTRSRIRP
jgi:hypothetical protein